MTAAPARRQRETIRRARVRKLAVGGVLAAFALATSTSAATEIGYGAHLSYGIGAGSAVGDIDGGFRQNLDVGAVVGAFDVTGGGMWSSKSGWIVGSSAILGFGAYPTYLTAEGGLAADTTLAGGAGTLGLAARVAPEPGAGLAARISGDVLFLNVGMHVMTMLVGERDVQVTLLLGLGRY